MWRRLRRWSSSHTNFSHSDWGATTSLLLNLQLWIRQQKVLIIPRIKDMQQRCSRAFLRDEVVDGLLSRLHRIDDCYLLRQERLASIGNAWTARSLLLAARR